eukprot:362875-Chlamydomonas_euryale.AAC.2
MQDEVLHSMLKTYWEISEYQGGTPVSRQPMDWQRGKPQLFHLADPPRLLQTYAGRPDATQARSLLP